MCVGACGVRTIVFFSCGDNRYHVLIQRHSISGVETISNGDALSVGSVLCVHAYYPSARDVLWALLSVVLCCMPFC